MGVDGGGGGGGEVGFAGEWSWPEVWCAEAPCV